MNKQSSSSLSFFSKFDASCLFDLAKELPLALETANVTENGIGSNSLTNTENLNGNDLKITGTHILVPQSSFSQMIETQFFNFNNNINNYIEQNSSNSDQTPILEFNLFDAFSLPETSNTPSADPFPGFYNFNVSLKSSSNVKKSAPWTYSKTLNKIYCSPAVACPIDFTLSHLPPLGTIIRGTLVYSKQEHVETLVKRCENHIKSKEFGDLPESNREHFLRSTHSKAIYECDQKTQRQSVLVPFEKPQVGSSTTTVLYQFMCYSSCIGGVQKPVNLILSLELNGNVLGRASFEIKICACPGRDQLTDEKKALKQKPTIMEHKKSIQQTFPIVETNSKNTNNFINNLLTRNDSDQDNELFTLQIKGRKNYEFIKKIYSALEAESILSKLKRSNTNQKFLEEKKNDNQINKSKQEIQCINHQTKRKNDQTDFQSLEHFLESIDMSAYYNQICSKGIKNIDDLLGSDKKKIESLKISKADTNILWDSILKLKASKSKELNQTNHHETESLRKSKRMKKIETENSFRRFDDLVEISKYQIEYTFDNL